MVIEFSNDPNLTPEERLQSLKENVQLALNEQQQIINNLSKSLLKAFGVEISDVRSDMNSFAEQIEEITGLLSDEFEELKGAVDALTDLDIGNRLTAVEGSVDTLEDTTIPALDTRIDDLENKIPAAPTTDGEYKLTVTVTSGVPTYTWVVVTPPTP